MKNVGKIWSSEEAEMLEYDKKHRGEWEELGMTPPSYTTNGKIALEGGKEMFEITKNGLKRKSNIKSLKLQNKD